MAVKILFPKVHLCVQTLNRITYLQVSFLTFTTTPTTYMGIAQRSSSSSSLIVLDPPPKASAIISVYDTFPDGVT